MEDGWNIGYPHPYFGRKILVFLRLEGGLRCKILKTMKFPAKYSWQRSYVTYRLLFGNFRLKAARKDVPRRLEGKLLRMIVHEMGK
jgi:hypothetical protein